MKQKKTPLFVPVLWFITTGLWTITFSLNWFRHSLSEGIVLLQGIVVLVSLAAAIANLRLYRKTKDQKQDL